MLELLELLELPKFATFIQVLVIHVAYHSRTFKTLIHIHNAISLQTDLPET